MADNVTPEGKTGRKFDSAYGFYPLSNGGCLLRARSLAQISTKHRSGLLFGITLVLSLARHCS